MAKRKAARSGGGVLFNVLAAAFMLMSCVCGITVAALFIFPDLNPVEALRPLPGPDVTEAALVPTRAPLNVASATPTSAVPTLPPEWTATHTPTITQTPPPSGTPTETPTETPIPPTETLTPTPTITRTPTPTGPTPTASNTRSPFNYTLQSGSPAYVTNFANNNGCSWFGMSGQVFDLAGKGVPGLFVHVEGPNNQTFDSPTGGFPKYGVSGWEVSLGTTPVATTNSYRVQLRNGSGQPLSDTITIPTFASCTQNHIIISFVQNH
jgi:hypothetical protein